VTVRILVGDALTRLAEIPDESVHCVVTSPPYWRCRDYGHAGQLGLEREPSEYVAQLLPVFRDARRSLRSDGSLWLNVGDVYAAGGNSGGGSCGDRGAWASVAGKVGFRMPPPGYKMKDLTLVAFQLASALRDDGWYLRSTIIWRKPAASEPARIDRPSSAHEYVFLLTKSEQYAVANPGMPWWYSTVWDIHHDNGESGHQAAMPSELAMRCILCGCPEGGTVLDPFGGAGTTGLVAQRLNRNAVLVELNPDYAAMAERRIRGDAPMFSSVEVSA
jgi:DNA modification methylase